MATTDTLAAVVAWLYNHASWPVDVSVVGLELPEDWRPASGSQPGKTAIVVPDAGTRSLDLPEIRATFAVWCYGPTQEAAREVADLVCGIVHRFSVTNVTLTTGNVHLGPCEVTSEPVYMREPETHWHRWVLRMLVRVSENPQ